MFIISTLFYIFINISYFFKIKYDKLLISLTNAASYMKKAVETLCVSFPKMIHVTCIVHALHRVCETIRSLYRNVNKLVANGKKVFVKAPTRIDLFKNKNHNISLPSTPTVTRWGTWLSAVMYYADNFDTFKSSHG